MCGVWEKESELGGSVAFLGTQKSHPNLAQPLKDHWLKEVPRHISSIVFFNILPFISCILLVGCTYSFTQIFHLQKPLVCVFFITSFSVFKS